MIDISLSDENDIDDINYINDENFSILSFNLNIGGMALNKEYQNDEIKNVHSPFFFKSIENKILIGHPDIIILVTGGDLDRGTYFHSYFLPEIMNKLKYKSLVRDKNSKNNKMGTLRISIYIKLNDDTIKNIELNKKIISNNNIYTTDNCTSLVLYIQTSIGIIAFIGIYTLDKNIIEIENKFLKDKRINYIFILGDLPNIENIENYEKTSFPYKIDDFFQHGCVYFHCKTNRIENIIYNIIKDENIGFKTKCNLGLLGFYRIITQEIKSINIFETDKFPKFCLSDKLEKNIDRNILFNIEISHNCVFFLSNNKIFYHIDNELPFYKDKFFLQRKTTDFNGYWIIENRKNIIYNEFLELNTNDENIKAFSSGYEHIIFLTESGKIYSLGNNKYGQLGLPLSKIYYLFQEINIDDVLLIKCGSFHTIINTKIGLYSFGNNLFGQLGIKEKYLSYVYTPTKININFEIKDISCGDYHTILLTNKGDIYGFGSNKYGQLGIDNYDDDIIYPMKLNLTNVLSICCGDNHSMINTKDGLYIFYKNNQLKNIHKINLNNILTMSCGKDYSLILTESGLFGFNLLNLIPITINIQNVNSLSCGFNKSIVQTRRNHSHIYMFHNILDNSMIQYIWDVI
jgi:hypothetical protein